MTQNNEHFRLVDQWVKQSLTGLPRDALEDALQKAIICICSQAQMTLGAVTMHAISDRVLFVGSQHYPWLCFDDADDHGITLTNLIKGLASVGDDDLTLGFGFLISELLTVIGTLSAEVISAKLHGCLKRPITNDGKK